MQVQNSSSSWRIGGVSTSQCYIVSLFDASFVSLSLCLDFNVEDQLGHFREDFFFGLFISFTHAHKPADAF